MKINNLGYLIKEGLKGIFQRGFMSFAAVCVTVACLLIVGTFSVAMYNVDKLVTDLNQTNEIRVFISYDMKEADAKSIGTKINTLENIKIATYVPRSQALEDLKKAHPDTNFGGIYEEDLHYRFKVLLEDNTKMDQTIQEIKDLDSGIVNVKAAEKEAAFITKLQQVLSVVSVVAIAVLLVISLLIISNTVKLVMYDRRDEISIMKMVGATNGFIRLPFLVEGLTLGMLGAGIAFCIEWMVYDAILVKMDSISEFKIIQLVPFENMLLPMIFTFCAAGLFVGIVGSWTSIRKFLDV
ncbi:MAG: permease-like cell division protein FtsX [Oscillospiraceae bacterium]|nr:permease-like cell division protein FtsX [Oscillospiraceae bacterium]